MIFCKQLLFIHAPKTGGMSVSEFLLKVLPRPFHYTHPLTVREKEEEGIIHVPGTRHESLVEARRSRAWNRFPTKS